MISTYIGAYVLVNTPLKENKITIKGKACPNATCTKHAVKSKNKFCPDCGNRIIDGTFTKTEIKEIDLSDFYGPRGSKIELKFIKLNSETFIGIPSYSIMSNPSYSIMSNKNICIDNYCDEDVWKDGPHVSDVSNLTEEKVNQYINEFEEQYNYDTTQLEIEGYSCTTRFGIVTYSND